MGWHAGLQRATCSGGGTVTQRLAYSCSPQCPLLTDNLQASARCEGYQRCGAPLVLAPLPAVPMDAPRTSCKGIAALPAVDHPQALQGTELVPAGRQPGSARSSSVSAATSAIAGSSTLSFDPILGWQASSSVPWYGWMPTLTPRSRGSCSSMAAAEVASCSLQWYRSSLQHGTAQHAWSAASGRSLRLCPHLIQVLGYPGIQLEGHSMSPLCAS